jgi:hypothetical protein
MSNPFAPASEVGGTADTYASPAMRAWIVIGALGVCAVGDVITLLGTGLELMLGPDSVTGTLIAGLGAIASFFGLVVSAIVWLVWQHRVARNAAVLSGFTLTTSPGWGLAYWFIPFVNLVRPYQAVGEIWTATEGASRDPAPGSGLIPVWWGFWIASNLVANISFRLTLNGITTEWVDIVAGILDLAAAALAVYVVLGITRAQERVFREKSA